MLSVGYFGVLCFQKNNLETTMLAIFGFVFSGLCFLTFAYTLRSVVMKKTGLDLDLFSFAFYALGLAFLIWGVAASVGQGDFLNLSVIIGEGLILAASIALLLQSVTANRQTWLVTSSVAAAALLYARVTYFYPNPVISDGIVIFNMPRVIFAVLGLIIILVWLPACIRVAKQITTAVGQPGMARTYSAIYATAAVSAVIFISTRRPVTAIMSFSALTICFALLIASNLIIPHVKGRNGKS